MIIGIKVHIFKRMREDEMKTPSIPKITCPATILAINRTARVIKRTVTLTNSIIIRKGIRGVGDPVGTNEASQDLGANVIAEIMNLIHSGRERDRAITRWAEIPKT